MIGLMIMAAARPSVVVEVIGKTPCRYAVNGKAAEPAEIDAILAHYSGKIVIRYGSDLPYRCIGGIIYDLQRAGHMRIKLDLPRSASGPPRSAPR